MNPKMKQAILADRRRRKDGTFMNFPVYGDRSGSRGITPGGGSYPIYPSMDWPFMVEGRFRDRDYPDRGTEPNMGYPFTPLVPPIYRGEQYERIKERRDRPMNKIGFANPDELRRDGYGSRADMPHMNEMEHMTSPKTLGYADSTEVEPLTHEKAMRWVQNMKNADGTTGAHWSMDQARQIMEQQHITEDEVEFYVTLNMIYSDYCKVAKRNNCSTIEFYAAMAKAFLDDKDAQPEKLSKYYECIVKH